jgi:hypothetical protein
VWWVPGPGPMMKMKSPGLAKKALKTATISLPKSQPGAHCQTPGPPTPQANKLHPVPQHVKQCQTPAPPTPHANTLHPVPQHV